MITITRNLARQLRAVFRRAGIKSTGSEGPRMHFVAGSDGLRIRAVAFDAAVEHHQPGELPAEQFCLPLESLELCQGRRDDPITLETRPGDKVLATWRDGGVPQMVEFDAKAPDQGRSFPEIPTEFVSAGTDLWQALHDARGAIDQESSRYALGNLQLRGLQGQINATDGRQMFQHGGFRFPWSDDVLIPGMAVLGCSELADETNVAVGRTRDCVGLRLGAWTVLIQINKEGRFPRMDDVLAAGQRGTTKVCFSASDARFLAKALPKLPHDDLFNDPITLALDGQVMVRAKPAADSPQTELVLVNSRFTGDRVSICMNRKFLARALAMGFTELTASGPDQPVLCADDRRQHLWAVLARDGIVGPAENAIRIESPPDTGDTVSNNHQLRGRTRIMSETTSTHNANGSAAASGHTANGHAAVNGHAEAKSQLRRTSGRKPGSKSPGTPIEQAVALKGSLRDTLRQTNELIRSLRRQKKQSRLVATALASIKELKAAG